MKLNIKNEKGITLTMLTVSIVVMLVIATVLIYFSVGDTSILNNANNAEFKEEMEAIKGRVDQKIITKQNIEGKDKGVTLSDSEKKEILAEYESKLDVDEDGNLVYNDSEFTKQQKKILEKLGIEKNE